MLPDRLQFWIAVFTLTCIGAALIAPLLIADIGWIIFALILFLTGIPHGACDHVVYNYVSKEGGNRHTFQKFIGIYLLVILIYSISWIFFPIPSLLFFLMLSAFHFGQSQFQTLGLSENNPLKISLYTLWGFTVLSAIIFLNWEESAGILEGFFPANKVITEAYRPVLTYLVIGFATITALYMAILWSLHFFTLRRLLLEYLYLCILLALAAFTPLLIAFSIYFGLWHAPRSIYLQINYIQRIKPLYNLRTFILEAIPFSLLSFIGIGLLVFAVYLYKLGSSVYMPVFIAISTLTLPHTFLMDLFYKRFSSPPSLPANL